MSWISQNYEKASIGGGIVVALGLAFLGWSKVGGVKEDFNAETKGNGGKNIAVDGAERIPTATSSLTQKRVWTPALDGDRPVELFASIPLFIKKDAPGVLIDLLKDAPVHEGIPNEWWLKNRIDPGFADSPKRDPDKDGFSNLEEFTDKTDPNNADSHPSLVAKLKYVRDESLQWLLDPGMELNPGEFSIRYYDSNKGLNRASAVNPVKEGDMFFRDGVMANRFKLLKSEKVQEENASTHSMDDKTYLTIEDERSNKKGQTYRIPNNIPDGRKKDFYHYDRTAVLTLEAVGQGGVEFKIEENTKFGLPADSGKKEYLLKKVTPEGIEVEYTSPSGETKTTQIPKG